MLIKTQDGDKNVSSKGLAGTALGLAIPGTVALVNQLGSLLGGTSNSSSAVATLESALAQQTAERYADKVGIEVYKEAVGLSNKNDEKANTNFYELARAVGEIDKRLSVAEAVNTATINNMQGQIAQLYSLTKMVVPNTSVCPGWGNVTITPSTTA